MGGRLFGWRAGVTNELEREIEKGTRVSYRCARLRSRRVFRELCSSLTLFRLFVRSLLFQFVFLFDSTRGRKMSVACWERLTFYPPSSDSTSSRVSHHLVG